MTFTNVQDNVAPVARQTRQPMKTQFALTGTGIAVIVPQILGRDGHEAIPYVDSSCDDMGVWLFDLEVE
jgi:hypothetical protein